LRGFSCYSLDQLVPYLGVLPAMIRKKHRVCPTAWLCKTHVEIVGYLLQLFHTDNDQAYARSIEVRKTCITGVPEPKTFAPEQGLYIREWYVVEFNKRKSSA